MFQGKFVEMSLKKNAKLSQDKNAEMFQWRNAKRSRDKNVKTFPDKFVKMFSVKNAKMFQDKSVTMCREKCARVFQERNVSQFRESNVKMFQYKCARLSVKTFSGAKYASRVDCLMPGSHTDHFKTDPPCLLVIFCTKNFKSRINMTSTPLVIFNSSNEERNI